MLPRMPAQDDRLLDIQVTEIVTATRKGFVNNRGMPHNTGGEGPLSACAPSDLAKIPLTSSRTSNARPNSF